MAKGIKMDSGRKKSFGGRIFQIDQISKEDNDDLICKYCPARIMYVSSYVMHSSKRRVSAHLKLWPKENHRPDCRNTVAGAVRQVVAQSKSVEGNQPLIKEQQDGSFIFRLNFLKNPQKIMSRTADDCINNVEDKVVFRTNYIKSEQQIESYFRSAVGVARIRALIQKGEHEELQRFKELVKIQYKGSSYSWSNFYYEHDRYHFLVDKFETSSIDHPISLLVTPKKSCEYFEERSYHWTIQCFSEQHNNEGKKKIIIPRIKTNVEEIAHMFTVQSSYIVIGFVQINTVTRENDTFHNIDIFINARTQFQIDIGD